MILLVGIPLALMLLLARRGWILAFLSALTSRLPVFLHFPLVSRVGRALQSLEVLRDREGTLRIGAWSILIWFTAVLTNYLVLQALDLAIHPVSALLILIVLQISVSLPTVPAAIGLYEYLCILALALFGVDETLAFSYGILLHAIVLTPVLVGVVLMGVSGVQWPGEAAGDLLPEEGESGSQESDSTPERTADAPTGTL